MKGDAILFPTNNMITLSKIKDEIKSYQEKEIEISPGIKWSQFKTLKRAFAYRSSRFTKGDIDPLTKKRKVFYQISRFRARTAASRLDFDVKDLRAISNRSFDIISQFKAYLLEKEIKRWAEENDFGILLNRIVHSVSDLGSAVVKVIKGEMPEMVDLRYIYFDPSVASIQDSPFVIEEKELRKDEIEEKRGIWSNVSDLLDTEDDKIKVYERYGIEKKGRKYIKTLTIMSDSVSGHSKGLELFKTKIDKYPYKDFGISRINGRWLGLGTYETLFDAQIRANTIANQKARALELSSRQIFWTPDDIVARNIMSDLDIGDIIKSPSGLNPLQVENRGLNEFASEESRYDTLADRLTFAYDVVRGETMGTTPATNAMIQNQNANSSFDQMREELGIQIIDFLKEFIIPIIAKKIKGEHILRFASKLSDIDKFDKMFTNEITRQAANKYLMDTGFYPEKEQIDNIKSKISDKLKRSGLIRSIKIPKGFFSNLSDIDIIIDTEARDISAQARNFQLLLTTLMSNPFALQNPLMKALVYAYAELIGIPPVELENIQEKAESETQNQTINSQINPQINANNTSPKGSLPALSQIQRLGAGQPNIGGLSQ